jgi:hypothetical protein
MGKRVSDEFTAASFRVEINPELFQNCNGS